MELPLRTWTPLAHRRAHTETLRALRDFLLRQAAAQAVADRLSLRIVVLSTFEESPVIQIDPHGGARSDRILHLSFWAEVRALCSGVTIGTGQPRSPCALQSGL